MRVLWLFNDYCAIPSFKCLLYSELYGDRPTTVYTGSNEKLYWLFFVIYNVSSLFLLQLVPTSTANQIIRQ